MKVIFLDHDGVICLESEWGTRFKKQKKWGGRKLSMTHREIPLKYRFDNFNPTAVKVLNEIIQETDCEIVVSSDWKNHGSLEDIGDYYLEQGISKKPIALTFPFARIYPELWSKMRFYADIEKERAMEIKYWVDIHSEITNWVAVDDLNMSIKFNSSDGEVFERDWGLENFVRTTNDKEGISEFGIKEKIFYFLNP